MGAVLVLDIPPSSTQVVGIDMMKTYLEENKFPVTDVPSDFYNLSGNFPVDIEKCIEIVRGRLDEVNSYSRVTSPLSNLSIALQCGGSDAFSGISANPLSGLVGREVILVCYPGLTILTLF